MISTHVLDTEAGRPAAGIRIELYDGDRLLGSAVTDEDGRVRDLSGGQAPGRGRVRLVFHVQRGFFEQVEVTVAIHDPSEHYHVPLLLSPYSCVLYRGS